ncbi:MAG: DUF4292 domain-containing protein [Deltaproteobacteria bacterium]|nr:DUF4292 domain-containing protein [Deltaproteobacteria bacterium]
MNRAQHRSIYVNLVFVLFVEACAHQVALSEQFTVKSTTEFLAQIDSHKVKWSSYVAEIRITYFGPEGRVRTTGTIAIKRPASMRCEMMGPHGGVISAFATNGIELQALDVKNSKFIYGPANVKNLDRLLPFAPLQLNAESWNKLLFGEIDIPETAKLLYQEKKGVFILRWQENSHDREVEIDPQTKQLKQAKDFFAGQLISQVNFKNYDKNGLPQILQVKVPSAKIEFIAVFRDIEVNFAIEAEAFVLNPPAGIALEHL